MLFQFPFLRGGGGEGDCYATSDVGGGEKGVAEGTHWTHCKTLYIFLLVLLFLHFHEKNIGRSSYVFVYDFQYKKGL